MLRRKYFTRKDSEGQEGEHEKNNHWRHNVQREPAYLKIATSRNSCHGS
jgi:hypothetical protein